MIYQKKNTTVFLFQVVSLRETERKLQLRAEELGMRVTEQENIIRELELALEHLMLQCDRRLTLQQKEHEQKMQLILLHCKGIYLWRHLVNYCRKYSRVLESTVESRLTNGSTYVLFDVCTSPAAKFHFDLWPEN